MGAPGPLVGRALPGQRRVQQRARVLIGEVRQVEERVGGEQDLLPADLIHMGLGRRGVGLDRALGPDPDLVVEEQAHADPDQDQRREDEQQAAEQPPGQRGGSSHLPMIPGCAGWPPEEPRDRVTPGSLTTSGSPRRAGRRPASEKATRRGSPPAMGLSSPACSASSARPAPARSGAPDLVRALHLALEAAAARVELHPQPCAAQLARPASSAASAAPSSATATNRSGRPCERWPLSCEQQHQPVQPQRRSPPPARPGRPAPSPACRSARRRPPCSRCPAPGRRR